MIVDRDQVASALPGYEVGAKLGRGAFGLVLAGRHCELNRDVAIKILSVGRETTPARGRTEARLLATLDHPHIVRVHDAVATDDLYLIVMEKLTNGTLSDRLEEMTAEVAYAVGLAVAAALTCAHRQPKKVLHRDIKPSNIMFDSTDLIKVTDFGVAKMTEGTATTTNEIMGTPLYMAPEQLVGGQLSPATDLYSLGALLYELLNGAPLFDPSLSVPALIHHHLSVTPPPPAGVPTPVAEVVMQAVAKKPADRQPSVHAFALALAHAVTAALGPGWSSRTGLTLHLGDDIRAAVGRPAADTASLPTSTAPKTPDKIHEPPAHLDDNRPTITTSRPSGKQLLTRRRLLLTALTIPVATAGTVLPVVLSDHEKEDDPAEPFHLLGSPLGGYSDAVCALNFSVDIAGRPSMITATRQGMVRRWEISDPTRPRLLGSSRAGAPEGIGTTALHPNGTILATADSGRTFQESTVRLWDISAMPTVRLLGSLPGHLDPVSLLSFHWDGNTLATTNATNGLPDEENEVRLWDVSDPAAARPLCSFTTGHTKGIESVVFSWDGRTLATAGWDDTARLWDISERTAARSLGSPVIGHASWIQATAFTSDGHAMATAGGNGTVRLWDVSDPAKPSPLCAPIAAHTGWVQSLEFAGDGRILITGGGGDATVRLWDVTDLNAPHPLGSPLTGHTGVVMSVAAGFAAPGQRVLASASQDRTVRLWSMD